VNDIWWYYNDVYEYLWYMRFMVYAIYGICDLWYMRFMVYAIYGMCDLWYMILFMKIQFYHYIIYYEIFSFH